MGDFGIAPGEMPIRSYMQSVSPQRPKNSSRLNARTELHAKRQRSARDSIYRKGLLRTSALTEVIGWLTFILKAHTDARRRRRRLIQYRSSACSQRAPCLVEVRVDVAGRDEKRYHDQQHDSDVQARVQGLTLVHFSAQLESFLTQRNTLNTLNTP
jgi:hypothetical protein